VYADLLGAQCLHGIETRGALCGKNAGGGGEQENRDACEDLGVQGWRLVQHAAQQTRGFAPGSEPDDESNDRGPHSIEQHALKYLLALCAQGDAETDLARAPGGDVQQDAKQPGPKAGR
jgi:hypothetical protein